MWNYVVMQALGPSLSPTLVQLLQPVFGMLLSPASSDNDVINRQLSRASWRHIAFYGLCTLNRPVCDEAHARAGVRHPLVLWEECIGTNDIDSVPMDSNANQHL
jgi:hypothetical protein